MVWQEAMNLAESDYSVFALCKDYDFKDQIQRASISFPSNMAEGFDRQTNKEFIQFLYISKGSASEARTQLYLAKPLNLIENNNADKPLGMTRKISAMLFNIIQTKKEEF